MQAGVLLQSNVIATFNTYNRLHYVISVCIDLPGPAARQRADESEAGACRLRNCEGTTSRVNFPPEQTVLAKSCAVKTTGR